MILHIKHIISKMGISAQNENSNNEEQLIKYYILN